MNEVSDKERDGLFSSPKIRQNDSWFPPVDEWMMEEERIESFNPQNKRSAWKGSTKILILFEMSSRRAKRGQMSPKVGQIRGQHLVQGRVKKRPILFLSNFRPTAFRDKWTPACSWFTHLLIHNRCVGNRIGHWYFSRSLKKTEKVNHASENEWENALKGTEQWHSLFQTGVHRSHHTPNMLLSRSLEKRRGTCCTNISRFVSQTLAIFNYSIYQFDQWKKIWTLFPHDDTINFSLKAGDIDDVTNHD